MYIIGTHTHTNTHTHAHTHTHTRTGAHTHAHTHTHIHTHTHTGTSLKVFLAPCSFRRTYSPHYHLCVWTVRDINTRHA